MTRDELIIGHLPLAKQMAREHRLCGIAIDDLEGEAYLGLTRAADEFAPAAHAEITFAAFASIHIRKALNEAIERDGLIRQPRALKRAAIRIRRTEEVLMAAGNDRPSIEEIAEASGLDLRICREVLTAPRVTEPVETLGRSGRDIEDVEQLRLTREVEQVLDSCTDAGRSVLLLHRVEGLSLRQVATRLGMPVCDVRRAHDDACRTVAGEMRRRGWTMPAWARAIA